MRPLLLTILFLALAGLAFFFIGVGAPPAHSEAPERAAPGPGGRSALLARTRQALVPGIFDAFIEEQSRRAEAEPQDAIEWRVLGEAYLERALLPDLPLGLAVGLPSRSSLPDQIERDVELGLAALDRAEELGEASAELHRLRAALHSRMITGLGSLMAHRGEVQAGLDRAGELGRDQPRVQIAIGCRLLFAPRGLGHDPAASIPHFLVAARALEFDERPLIYAAFANWLLDDAEQATELMQRAAERTPASIYAVAVVARLESGDEEPFRDLE